MAVDTSRGIHIQIRIIVIKLDTLQNKVNFKIQGRRVSLI